MRRNMLWVAVGITAGLLLIAAAVAAAAYNRPYTFRGSAIQDPFPAPEIHLPGGPGGDFQLSAQRGKLVVVFFGFTHCTDVCPTTLANMKQVRDRLGSDAGRVEVVFITVDPERDTPDVAAKYAAGFDPHFVGLSGNEAQLDPVWKAYGVYRKLDKTTPDDTNYMVEHSSHVYLVDSAGNLRLTYAYGTPADDILQDIRYLLKKN